jgi:outer membrane cobalamin receptor
MTFIEEGNPNLKPEEAREYEVSVEQPIVNKYLLKAAAFERKIDNLISWPETVPAPLTLRYSPVNIGKAEITGYEAEATAAPFEWLSLSVNYTYLKPIDETTGKKIYYTIPSDQWKSHINIVLPSKTNIYIEGRWVKNYVPEGNPLWRYGVVDGKITQPVELSQNLKADIFIGIKNAFDREYEVVRYYPMPPKEVYGGVAVKF